MFSTRALLTINRFKKKIIWFVEISNTHWFSFFFFLSLAYTMVYSLYESNCPSNVSWSTYSVSIIYLRNRVHVAQLSIFQTDIIDYEFAVRFVLTVSMCQVSLVWGVGEHMCVRYKCIWCSPTGYLRFRNCWSSWIERVSNFFFSLPRPVYDKLLI